MNLLEELQAELGLTYVFIAHDLAAVRHISDRIAVMFDGRMMGERRPQDTDEKELGMMMAGMNKGEAA